MGIQQLPSFLSRLLITYCDFFFSVAPSPVLGVHAPSWEMWSSPRFVHAVRRSPLEGWPDAEAWSSSREEVATARCSAGHIDWRWHRQVQYWSLAGWGLQRHSVEGSQECILLSGSPFPTPVVSSICRMIWYQMMWQNAWLACLCCNW